MLDTSFLENLSRLRLALGRNSSMNLSGNRKSSQKGTSTEFSGFREYIPGDDLRRIDWNAYGRLNKLYIKEYMEEKEAVVRILIDTSGSMNYGKHPKSELALKLALSFSFMAINNMDRVILYDLQNPQSPYTCSSGKKAIPPLLDWLNHLEFHGETSLSRTIYKLPLSGTGITIILSDFLEEALIDDEKALTGLLRYLLYCRQRPILLQTLSGEELNVDLTGTLNLIDMETEGTLKLTMENKSISCYEQALNRYLSALSRECQKAGASYALCDTETDFTKLIFQKLRFAYDI